MDGKALPQYVLPVVVIGLLAIALVLSLGGIESIAGYPVLDAGDFSLGVLAAGNFSVGLFSVGTFAVGIFAAGIFAVGIFSIGIFSVGIAAIGIYAIALYTSESDSEQESVL